MTSLKDLRSQFLNYFQSQDHVIMPSSPLVPDNDPTLLFTNAGMVQFKNIFTGAESRPSPAATTSQKCVRAGGKHNDLDNVGYTARHHTFFEMLGNFSFGDYFKEEAIHYAWEMITKDFGLSKDKLLVTIYHTDDEAFDIWKKISGFADEQIIRIATSDNFWAMGDTGPCGPCSEIFFDHGDHIPGGPPGSPDEDGDRFIEIWNLVFMQFEKHADGSQTELPKPSIDTGMGLERMAAIAQGVHDNYDVDLFQNLIKSSVAETGKKAVGDALFSHRVIADHLRSTSFLIADGVGPSNEGRGYVLRRIMRRAMRHAHILGAKDPLMHRLVPSLVTEMGEAYPELVRAQPVIEETLRQEEERFRRTLGRGEALLKEATAGLKAGDKLPGDVAFKLYDTYGFPVDLTEDALRADGIRIDHDGYDAAMAAQKEKSRDGKFSTGDQATDEIWFQIKDKFGATTFTGYGKTEGEGTLVAILRDGENVAEAGLGDDVHLVFDRTPFYAESGGQAGDIGYVDIGEAHIDITDVQKQAGDLHVLMGSVTKGFFKVGETAVQVVDPENRVRTMRNHSATHLAHSALRNVLGPHVSQKGQMVDGERIRFDFSHGESLTREQISRIEEEVNAVILANDDAETKNMSPDEAIEAGAMALFGEKYGDEVRVLTLGQSIGNPAYSVELCGGTHVGRTGDIGIFKIVSEGAVQAGVRRIEAVTGDMARDWYEHEAGIAKDVADSLKIPTSQLAGRVKSLADERKRLEKELADAKKQLALAGGGQGAGDTVEEIGGHKFMGRVLHGVGGRDLRGLIDEGKTKIGSGIVAYVGVADGKGAIAVGVTDDLKGDISAVDLVRAGAAAMGGKGGGGRPDMAQAGGPDADKADDAIAAIKAALS